MIAPLKQMEKESLFPLEEKSCCCQYSNLIKVHCVLVHHISSLEQARKSDSHFIFDQGRNKTGLSEYCAMVFAIYHWKWQSDLWLVWKDKWILPQTHYIQSVYGKLSRVFILFQSSFHKKILPNGEKSVCNPKLRGLAKLWIQRE